MRKILQEPLGEGLGEWQLINQATGRTYYTDNH